MRPAAQSLPGLQYPVGRVSEAPPG